MIKVFLHQTYPHNDVLQGCVNRPFIEGEFTYLTTECGKKITILVDKVFYSSSVSCRFMSSKGIYFTVNYIENTNNFKKVKFISILRSLKRGR